MEINCNNDLILSRNAGDETHWVTKFTVPYKTQTTGGAIGGVRCGAMNGHSTQVINIHEKI